MIRRDHFRRNYLPWVERKAGWTARNAKTRAIHVSNRNPHLMFWTEGHGCLIPNAGLNTLENPAGTCTFVHPQPSIRHLKRLNSFCCLDSAVHRGPSFHWQQTCSRLQWALAKRSHFRSWDRTGMKSDAKDQILPLPFRPCKTPGKPAASIPCGDMGERCRRRSSYECEKQGISLFISTYLNSECSCARARKNQTDQGDSPSCAVKFS